MWSNLPPSNNPAGHISLLTGSLASFAAKHRFLFIILVTILTLALIAGLFILQSAAASQKVQQAVSSEQQTSASTVTLPAASQEYTVATDEQAPTQPTQTHASVSQSEGGATVSINNETVQLPDNGSVQRTIQSDTGETQVNVSVNSDSSGSNTSFNSTSVNMNSSNMSSQSSISINNSQ